MKRNPLHRLLLCALLAAAPSLVHAEPERPSPAIQVFDGFGTPEGALVLGRALKKAPRYNPKPSDGLWRRLRESASLLLASPAKQMPLTVQIGDKQLSKQAVTNSHGVFRLELSAEDLKGLPVGENTVKVRAGQGRSFEGKMTLWPSGTKQVVFSDIDDTILDSRPTKKLQTLVRTFANNAHTMTAFKGAAKTLSRLSAEGNPVVYISSSPVSLQPRLRDFLKTNGFPVGPMVLKTWGFDKESDSPFDHQDYKIRNFRSVSALFRGARRVFIGDTGQGDSAAFQAMLKEAPGDYGILRRSTIAKDQRPANHPAFAGLKVADGWPALGKQLETDGVLVRTAPAAQRRPAWRPTYNHAKKISAFLARQKR